MIGAALATRIREDARHFEASLSCDSGRRAVTQDGYRVLVLTRLREAVRRGRLWPVNHLLRMLTTTLYGIEIGNDVTLGAGVNFVHTVGIVIGGDATLGERVIFYGSNTVGTASDNGYPTIGDDVVVGAGARILGPVTVGAGAVIGANSVVLSDVPAGVTVVGAPARVVDG